MKRNVRLIAGLLGATALMVGCNQAEPENEPAKLETLEEKVNYVFGTNLAENLAQGGVTIEPDAFAQALRDKRDGVEPRLSEEEMREVMQTFQEQEMARREAEQEAAAETNKQEAEAFFAENANAEGVSQTDSGLQYKVLEEGDGAKPGADDTVTVHYRGRLLDGTEFDSSYERDQPATFALNSVIAGWTEALQLMSEGSKYELYIPSDLAYGPGGNGPIPPNAALIFEVELLEIDDQADADSEGAE
ncbi:MULTISPECIES: FKBP-type peptidyl-prolyl cis-trans isomerase [Marinimicrobium]|jgi:FKBP-type peptidyl-prolyl cis-trans isomerase FkpA/FKBP-type peptidyl-prolyl cis-trans isomerase FklB|uniref:Peptidyl-prolyl cis-trans isomerase n=1 Tax=Marinimicrobium koreense TaxID=306545 RepID=A0A3N1NZ99_9GAMM|nr:MULTISPECIES: FKBP-type peptidyl-prolyl cis-trans isomerase [Marinimicrobium]ROQ18006.1 FKBP-type peptidyl-prolyl cis-trans isomerase FkpA/FKBP-type peptidyl-prolyl cis-trans isomerase FklB [Marinimicrobium koreense]|tara:strand:- start:345 stop:1085 length:741 start_codon:yes stop_codon:yes gene_type:complete